MALEPEPSLYAPPPLPEYEEHVDHAGMIADLDQKSYERGKAIYNWLCINPDGTFFVTDQEGHWTPKNRIN